MLVAPPDSPHPFLYARVLGIFHVNAYIADRADAEPVCIHVLWVRWYDVDLRKPWGFEACRLPRLTFASLDDTPFGFISPHQVLRASHIIPAFYHGRSDSALPGYSIARDADEDEDDQDWNYYEVGIFSDRDVFMRYLGSGVISKSARA
ncbi:hypothetical protein C8Q77DRAFT_179262 [Trametes polyzona]|nr:hypothetical protein C8Q77DRAFT_179262 [Trametes polyzona]